MLFTFHVIKRRFQAMKYKLHITKYRFEWGVEKIGAIFLQFLYVNK